MQQCFTFIKKTVRRSNKIVLIGFFAIAGGHAFGITPVDSTKIISGRVISATNGEPIPYANIVNLSKSTGTVSDPFGIFQIPMAAMDSLYISAIGFATLRTKVYFLAGSDTSRRLFYLSPVSYPIKEIVVRRWHDYNQFKREFLALKLPDTKTERLTNYLAAITKEAVQQVPQTSGIGFGEDWYHRQQRILDEYLARTGRKRMADERLNLTTVIREVHCSQEYAAQFLLWLKPDTEFVLQTRDYDLLVYVKEKYAEWCHLYNKC